jgi:hypothetical protein
MAWQSCCSAIIVVLIGEVFPGRLQTKALNGTEQISILQNENSQITITWLAGCPAPSPLHIATFFGAFCAPTKLRQAKSTITNYFNFPPCLISAEDCDKS